ncbi:hypothetical protein [Allonocardiopsis opalescens]|nr:hypothetical protein [Allonocardiopsis opalescens]
MLPSRSLRAAVFAAVCVGVSALGHALSSGHAVPWAVLVAAYFLVYAMAWAVARREQSQFAIGGWLVWGQLALHLLYSTAMPSDGSASASAALSAHASMGMAVPDAGSGGDGGSMLLAHLLAVVVSAWWLRRGEAAGFAFARFVRAVLLGLLARWFDRPPAPDRPRRAPAPAPRPRAAAVRLLRHVVVLRGPPRAPSAAPA